MGVARGSSCHRAEPPDGAGEAHSDEVHDCARTRRGGRRPWATALRRYRGPSCPTEALGEPDGRVGEVARREAGVGWPYIGQSGTRRASREGDERVERTREIERAGA